MKYLQSQPPAALAPWVESFWTLEDASDEPAASPLLVVPDGRPELIVHYGRPFVRRQGGADVVEKHAFLFGQLLEPIGLLATGDVGVVAARLRPEGLCLFGSQPAFELAGEAIPVADLGRGGGDLHEQISASRSRQARLGILESFLLSNARDPNPRRSRVSAAVDCIRQHQGRFPIKNVGKAVGIGRRQLERLFRERVGVSPKLFSRMVRFQALLRRLAEARGPRWADLAADSGYYDQAHMLRDFGDLAGCSANTYLAARHELAANIAQS